MIRSQLQKHWFSIGFFQVFSKVRATLGCQVGPGIANKRPTGAKLATERRFERALAAKLALERRFERTLAAKLALERRFGRPRQSSSPEKLLMAVSRRFPKKKISQTDSFGSFSDVFRTFFGRFRSLSDVFGRVSIVFLTPSEGLKTSKIFSTLQNPAAFSYRPSRPQAGRPPAGQPAGRDGR